MLNLGVIGNGFFLVFGVVWCREMFRRWRRDLDEFRSSGGWSSGRIAIAALWGATALILVFWVGSFVGILKSTGLV